MNIRYDETEDALYIRFSDEKYYQSDEVKEGVILDFNKDGKFIALELLDVSKHFLKQVLITLTLKLVILKERPDRPDRDKYEGIFFDTEKFAVIR